MDKSGGEQASCPVCGKPAGQEAACGECRWTLRSAPRPGPVTAALREQFEAGLLAARHAWDTGVAALLSPEREAYQDQIRGGPPQAAEWAAALQKADLAARGAADAGQLRASLASELEALQPGLTTTIVEIDAEGTAVATLGLDQFAAPLIDGRAETGWAEILPALSADPRRRAFQLAGGADGLRDSTLREALDAVLSKAEPGRLLVICRPAGWRVLERAAELAAGLSPASTVIRLGLRVSLPARVAGSDGLLSEIAAGMPSRCDYGLVVAIVDDTTGDVRTEVTPLFRTGDPSGREVSVPAQRIPGDDSEISFAVMTGQDGSAEPLTVLSGAPPAGAGYSVRAVLDGPGQIRFLEPAGLNPQSRPWREILAGLPPRVAVDLGPFDLVCAVEMAGPPDAVRARKELVRAVVELLETVLAGPDLLRVGILGCTDHVFEPGREKRQVVRGTPLGSPGAAKAALVRLRSADAAYPRAAPIEDMLAEAAGLLKGSSRSRRTARLLLVAGRPPHPVRQSSKSTLLPCPLKYDWQSSLRELTQAGARCVAVADELPRSRSQAEVWQALGQAKLLDLAGADARQVSDELGILPCRTPHIPLPLIPGKRP